MTTIILINIFSNSILKFSDFSQNLMTGQDVVNQIIKRELNPLNYRWYRLQDIQDLEA